MAVAPGHPVPIGADVAPILSVVVPAYDQETAIAANLVTIHERIASIGVPFEMIVVSDGSRDATENVARAVDLPGTRVIGYPRNQGKGYAVRQGSGAARGEYVGWVDSDLDLDPASLGRFLTRARERRLDAVIGSKRHPDSTVEYPVHRRAYSAMYQMLARVLFGLDVRDTQVGLKLFRREVLEETLPVVLVKRYAFDLEVLSVANHFGYRRIEEAPVTLTYQFAGTGINWRSIAHALWDTAAVAYRFRIRYYDRKRTLVEHLDVSSGLPQPEVTVLVLGTAQPTRGQVDAVERSLPATSGPVRVIGVSRTDASDPRRLGPLLAGISTEITALLDADSIPGGRWAASALELFGSSGVGAVVGPTISRLDRDPRVHAAAVLGESRFAVGGARARTQAGALHRVDEFPAGNLFVRTDLLRRAVDDGETADDDLCGWLSRHSDAIILCSPDVTVSRRPDRLMAPYIASLWRLGVGRGERIAAGRRPRARHLVPSAFVGFLAVAPAVVGRRSRGGRLVRGVLATYGACVAGFAVITQVMHRRWGVTRRAAMAAPASHVAFGTGLVVGLLRRLPFVARRAACDHLVIPVRSEEAGVASTDVRGVEDRRSDPVRRAPSPPRH